MQPAVLELCLASILYKELENVHNLQNLNLESFDPITHSRFTCEEVC